MLEDATEAVIAAAVEVVERESHAVADVSRWIGASFVDAAGLLMSCTGKVILSGVGTSGFVARRAAHLFAVSGTPSLYLHPTEGLHGSLGALRSDDVLIVLSKGGASDEVNELVRRAKRESISVIALTADESSELADLADIAVTIPADPEADPGGVIAMGSTLAHSVWLDALSVVLMRAKNYGWDRVLFTHPGGAVGQTTALPEPLAPLEVPLPSESADG